MCSARKLENSVRCGQLCSCALALRQKKTITGNQSRRYEKAHMSDSVSEEKQMTHDTLLHVVGEIVETIRLVPQEHISDVILEQMVYVLVPHVM